MNIEGQGDYYKYKLVDFYVIQSLSDENWYKKKIYLQQKIYNKKCGLLNLCR